MEAEVAARDARSEQAAMAWWIAEHPAEALKLLQGKPLEEPKLSEDELKEFLASDPYFAPVPEATPEWALRELGLLGDPHGG